MYLGLIEKRAVDFLLAIIELFSLDVTAKALRVKIDRKSAISLQSGQCDSKFRVECNFAAESFHTKKLRSRHSSREVRFQRENGRFTFLSPLWWT